MMEYQTQFHDLTNTELAKVLLEHALVSAVGGKELNCKDEKPDALWYLIEQADILIEAAKRLQPKLDD